MIFDSQCFDQYAVNQIFYDLREVLTPEQIEEFRVATRPVWDKFMNQFPKELVQMVLDTQK